MVIITLVEKQKYNDIAKGDQRAAAVEIKVTRLLVCLIASFWKFILSGKHSYLLASTEIIIHPVLLLLLLLLNASAATHFGEELRLTAHWMKERIEMLAMTTFQRKTGCVCVAVSASSSASKVECMC